MREERSRLTIATVQIYCRNTRSTQQIHRRLPPSFVRSF
ncbi:hypothetical protein BVRB_4g085160 [Beta vulgaris subsp. vulgaris]|nr:hypothetical protein BVRB_4g085160 [Beta vulgaris subsp. vulgaris]